MVTHKYELLNQLGEVKMKRKKPHPHSKKTAKHPIKKRKTLHPHDLQKISGGAIGVVMVDRKK